MLTPLKPAWANTFSEVATMWAIVVLRMRPPNSASPFVPSDGFLLIFICILPTRQPAD